MSAVGNYDAEINSASLAVSKLGMLLKQKRHLNVEVPLFGVMVEP